MKQPTVVLTAHDHVGQPHASFGINGTKMALSAFTVAFTVAWPMVAEACHHREVWAPPGGLQRPLHLQEDID